MFALRIPGALLLINAHAADRLPCRPLRWLAGRTACNRKLAVV